MNEPILEILRSYFPNVVNNSISKRRHIDLHLLSHIEKSVEEKVRKQYSYWKKRESYLLEVV